MEEPHKADELSEDSKLYIKANELYLDSFRLAKIIWNSGLRPNFIVGIWRGGTPIGCAIHEFFRVKYQIGGLDDAYHTAIKTQSYSGFMTGNGVEVKGLEHVIEIINSEDRMLIVDDVFDTGETIKEVLKQIHEKARKNCPEIRVATIYFKPEKNQTDIEPNFYLKTTNKWIVFPHELEGLTRKEIMKKSSVIHNLLYS